MAIRILLADDHALLRQGIKRVLNFEDDLEVVGEAEDGQEALARTLMLKPDILLLDINMPGLTGLDVTKQLKQARARVKIIALTRSEERRVGKEGRSRWAACYVKKKGTGVGETRGQ